MTKKRVCIGIALMMLLSVFGLAGCKSNPVKSIELYIDFSLPTDMEVVYNYQPTGFVQGGRHPQYTVFQLRERPDEFLSEQEFITASSPDEINSHWLHGYEDFDVPTDYYPPWDEEFIWRGASPVFLIYFDAQKWLIAIIEGN